MTNDAKPLRLVAWCNLWNYAAALHTDVGTKIHLTASAGAMGKTLCGKAFPGDKGHPAYGGMCKRCLNAAHKQGYAKDFTSGLAWVPSTDDAYAY